MRIAEDLAAQRGTLQGVINVGTLPLCRTTLLPRAVSRLIKAHPKVKVMTDESDYESLVASLRGDGIDFILGALRKNEGFKDLDNEVLFSEELILLARSGHPLSGKVLNAEDLLGAQMILPRRNSPARHLLNEAFIALGLPKPMAVVESGDLAIVRGILMNSDMVAVVSGQQLDLEVDNGMLKTLDIKLSSTRRCIGITSRQGAMLSPAVRTLGAGER